MIYWFEFDWFYSLLPSRFVGIQDESQGPGVQCTQSGGGGLR